MKFPEKNITQTTFQPPLSQNKVLISNSYIHTGIIFNCASKGGRINIGTQYQLELVAKGNGFMTLQLYRYGLNRKPETQTWVREKIKREVVEKQVFVKPEKTTKKFIKDDEIEEI